MDDLIAATPRRPGCRQLRGLTVITVRHLAGDQAARNAVQGQGLSWLSQAGDTTGSDPLLAWRGPHELIVIGRDAAALYNLLTALAPGRHDTAMAVDLSEASAVFELRGPALDAWLARLVDASALPGGANRTSRCRMIDVPVQLIQRSTECMWMVFDAPLVPYAKDWLAHSYEALCAFMDAA